MRTSTTDFLRVVHFPINETSLPRDKILRAQFQGKDGGKLDNREKDKLIDLWRGRTCLLAVNSPKYSDRVERLTAISESAAEVDTSAASSCIKFL